MIDCVGGYAGVKSFEQAQEMVMVSSTIQLLAKYQQQAFPSSQKNYAQAASSGHTDK